MVLNETGVTTLRDGTVAVNVGPIVAALGFLTEGRGEDRGTDELGQPLPDLMSLAFDVVQSIIVGGRKAEFFRKVKRDLDELSEASGQSSLKLAKRAERVERPAEATALDDAADALKSLLGRAGQLSLEPDAARDLQRSLEGFRDFGADRWVSATAQLLMAMQTLGPALAATEPEPVPAPRRKRKARSKPVAAAPVKASRKKRAASRATAKPSKATKPVKVAKKKKRARHA